MKEIIAKEGMWLTQATTLEDDNFRIFVRKIAGFNINAEDWRDATDAEKEQWESEHIEQLRYASNQEQHPHRELLRLSQSGDDSAVGGYSN